MLYIINKTAEHMFKATIFIHYLIILVIKALIYDKLRINRFNMSHKV